MICICNWCRLSLQETGNQSLLKDRHVYECRCLPRFLAHPILPSGVESTMVIEKNGKVTFYDIYHQIDDVTYNIEGAFDYTVIVSLKESISKICKMPFYIPKSDYPINELIGLSTKIIKLKAFT